MKPMKAILAAVALPLLMSSCTYKAVHDKADGLVEQLIYDSLMTVNIDGESVDFDISVAKYSHGRVMQGDSVVVYYYGDLRKKRALAESIYLKDRAGKVLEVKHGQKPVNAEAPAVRPMDDPDEAARNQRVVRSIQKYVNKK